MAMDEESLVGTRLADRFQIESLLGKGGMGAVYLARHVVLQRLFAVKVIRESLITDLDIAARFRREARAASRVEHPHITSVVDFGYTEEGRPYLVMEHVEGIDLADLLAREGPLPLERALHILAQVADALAAAHASQVIHRDLKPENILLTAHRGQPDFVKILDFGVAKIIGMGSTDGLSIRGVPFCTPEYMSPEQCTGDDVDHRSDIYSFGILAFELLVGEVPFQGSMMQQVMAHVGQQPPAPSAASGRSEIGPAVDALILRCLAKSPDARYQDADALAAEVRGRETRPLRRTTGLYLVEGTGNIPRDAVTLLSETRLSGAPACDLHGTMLDERSGRVHQAQVLEELACSVRDRGLGSLEISQTLARKLVAEDRVLEIEARMRLLELEIVEIEMAARERELRLMRALVQLEHEQTTQLAAFHQQDPSRTLLWGSTAPAEELRSNLAWLADALEQHTALIQRIPRQMEQEVATRQAEIDGQRRALEQPRGELAEHEARLVELLQQVRAMAADPGLEHLFELAGVG